MNISLFWDQFIFIFCWTFEKKPSVSQLKYNNERADSRILSADGPTAHPVKLVCLQLELQSVLRPQHPPAGSHSDGVSPSELELAVLPEEDLFVFPAARTATAGHRGDKAGGSQSQVGEYVRLHSSQVSPENRRSSNIPPSPQVSANPAD